MKIPFFKGEILRRSSIVFLSAFSSSLIALVANLVIAGLLKSENFGNFKTVIYLFAFLPMLFDLGINASLTKYIAEFGKNNKKINYVIGWFLKIKIISFVFLMLITFLLKDYIALYLLKNIALNYLVFAGIFLAASSFFLTFNFIVLGFQNFRLFGLSQFLYTALPAVFAVFLIPLGVFYMILGWGIGQIIASLPNIMFLLKKRIFNNYEKIDIKKIFFRFSLPIYPIEVSIALVSAIVPLLSLFFSQKLIGYYSFAFMFYVASQLIPNSLSFVLFPKFSELNGLKRYGDAKKILRKSLLYYGLIFIAGLALVFLLSEWFLNTFAKTYLPSLFLFNVIASLGILFGFNVIYANYLKGLGKVKKYALFVLLQNILMIVVSFVLLNYMM